ncbi:hypothetical protein QE369_001110 [Agrobacterium larrymoorei]|uniref:Uncharacterized protein n=1 Tax=Agrobacterium larrymoorei TaxID=160699 RepID=A0AAJ2EU04_9HYPH|nr:hypothetical protein [Agrobacterium larrymoorei]
MRGATHSRCRSMLFQVIHFAVPVFLLERISASGLTGERPTQEAGLLQQCPVAVFNRDHLKASLVETAVVGWRHVVNALCTG